MWNINVDNIKQEVYRFFQAKFRENWPTRPKLINPKFRASDLDISRNLESPFSMDEIRVAVWACFGEMAPVPDGFTFKFIKNY